MNAPIPVDEEARLKALLRYQILDTPPEEVFEDLTLLAAQVCGTPVALISFVDRERLWLKSRRGVGVDQIPREHAFCSHGILERDVFIVEDALQDSRFADNPMVCCESGIRFYAGAPLKTADGYRLGMLCVTDKVPRRLTSEQIASLRALARQAASQLELRLYTQQLTLALAERERIQVSLEQAEARYRNIFENTAEGIFQSSQQGRFLTANSALAALLGCDSSEKVQQIDNIAQDLYLSPERRTDFERILNSKGVIRDFEVQFRRRDGSVIWVAISARLVKRAGQEPPIYEGTLRDISHCKLSEEAQRRIQQELEEKVAERTTGLQIAIARLNEEIASRRRIQEELELTQERLVEASHQAGKAELASEILHNVRNVINNIKVSAAMVSHAVSHSKASQLANAAALLEANASDLPGFFASNPKGKLLADYLSKLAVHLGKEQEETLHELTTLHESVEHIAQVVTLQQSLAKEIGPEELQSIPELVEQALRLNWATLQNHQVEVERDYAQVPRIPVQKHKILQILVNLISNARAALDLNDVGNRRLRVQVKAPSAGVVQISVTDNGIGIPRENLERIFQHGFTTKKDGHGFGLHSSLMVAKEQGGSLIVQSEGPNKGATFVLELPGSP